MAAPPGAVARRAQHASAAAGLAGPTARRFPIGEPRAPRSAAAAACRLRSTSPSAQAEAPGADAGAETVLGGARPRAAGPRAADAVARRTRVDGRADGRTACR
eukprot:scaffold4987_cov363-Prasinococcus_capsulatus_cf.AAC.1